MMILIDKNGNYIFKEMDEDLEWLSKKESLIYPMNLKG